MTRRSAAVAAALYLAAALLMTWPLGLVIDREIAWDLGDPLFNAWVLLWTGGQVLAFLGGDWSALSRFWHGNIFHPERLTIAYSEHLFPQMLQALPVLGLTDNAVLAYNLLFLSTFVLSGLGTFLFVRELTKNPLAAFIAGLAFAFTPYRVSQLSHLQVLSVQWMPLVLFAFRRYFETRRLTPLAWGSAALVVQNLSCGYYLLFFAPFVGLYVIFEMATRGLLLQWQEWRRWIIAALIALACTFPFLRPYLEVREGTSAVGVRTAGEIALFSADVHALATAPPALWIWGERLQAFPRGEGEGFLGFTILLLAVIGWAAGLLNVWRSTARTVPRPPWQQVLIGLAAVFLIGQLIASASYLIAGSFSLHIGDTRVTHRDASETFTVTLVLMVAALSIRRVRRLVFGTTHVITGFVACCAILSTVLAFGPSISVGGDVIARGPYDWFVGFVPGFDGVRVPARFLMLTALFLAVLSGFGMAVLLRAVPRLRVVTVATMALMILAEAWPGPFRTNVRLAAEGYLPTPREIATGADLPAVYRYLRDTQEPLILIELPFGSHAWDLQSVYYAGYHRRPLVNGYSGFFPESQRHMVTVMDLVGQNPDAAWRGLVASGATHAIVHEDAFIDSQKGLYTQWLLSHGASEIMTDGDMRLFRIR